LQENLLHFDFQLFILQDNYDEVFLRTVYGSALLSVDEILANVRPEEEMVRVQYDDKPGFKAIAKHLGFMDDFKVYLFGTEFRMSVNV